MLGGGGERDDVSRTKDDLASTHREGLDGGRVGTVRVYMFSGGRVLRLNLLAVLGEGE